MTSIRRSGRGPTVHVVAGPNGAGKTTFALEYLPGKAKCRRFLNVDLMARGLSPLDVDAAAVPAARLFLQELRSCVRRRQTFGFETTLAGLGHLRLLSDMRRRGYRVHLYFLWLPTAGLALRRIAERVRLGGHSVPAPVVRRRFSRGLRNLFTRYWGLVDYCAIFDNASKVPILVYERSGAGERLSDAVQLARVLKAARKVRP